MPVARSPPLVGRPFSLSQTTPWGSVSHGATSGPSPPSMPLLLPSGSAGLFLRVVAESACVTWQLPSRRGTLSRGKRLGAAHVVLVSPAVGSLDQRHQSLERMRGLRWCVPCDGMLPKAGGTRKGAAEASGPIDGETPPPRDTDWPSMQTCASFFSRRSFLLRHTGVVSNGMLVCQSASRGGGGSATSRSSAHAPRCDRAGSRWSIRTGLRARRVSCR